MKGLSQTAGLHRGVSDVCFTETAVSHVSDVCFTETAVSHVELQTLRLIIAICLRHLRWWDKLVT
jgi:hypothetical protein